MKNLRKPVFVKRKLILIADLLKGILIAGLLAFFFYRSLWALLPMMIPAGMFIAWERKKGKEKLNRQLLQQFGECILSVGNSVRSGYAAENAFVESMKDMEMMYGADAEVLEELKHIKGGLINNLSLEKLLQDMGQRTGLEEIQEFAEIFVITKRNGGSIADVISMTAQNINSRIVLEAEIHTLLASRKLEQKIMNLIPFLLMLYLELTTPGYFDMFFRDFSGTVLMTLFLLWYMAAYGLSEYVLWKLSG